MKLDLFNSEASNIWKNVISDSTPARLKFELDLYKKLLSFFQVGDYYYWIFNMAGYQLDLVKEVEGLLGYDPSEVSLQFLFDKMHPEDRPWILDNENKATGFLSQLPVDKLTKYKIRYDYRLKKSNGDYIRILHQSMIMEHDAQGRVIRTLGVHTDINHLKPDGKPVFSIIGMDGEPSYINIDVEKVFAISTQILTPREKQVLLLMVEGKSSKQVANELGITKETTDRHRKNMLFKTKVNSTGELIAKAIRQGWI